MMGSFGDQSQLQMLSVSGREEWFAWGVVPAADVVAVF
jgi:hypothetical protein